MDANQKSANDATDRSLAPVFPVLTISNGNTASRMVACTDDVHETLKLPALAPLIPSATAPLILIADDEVAVRKGIRLVMEISGYRVEEVGRGMQVLACLHHNPEVVLLDINMPGLNGIETLVEIRKRHPHLKVIIVSGQTDPKLGPPADTGAFDYIPKPVDAHKLIAAVNRAMATCSSEPNTRFNLDTDFGGTM
jgi:CheY-like chemotaxis protein